MLARRSSDRSPSERALDVVARHDGAHARRRAREDQIAFLEKLERRQHASGAGIGRRDLELHDRADVLDEARDGEDHL